jgi:hypothetical protein
MVDISRVYPLHDTGDAPGCGRGRGVLLHKKPILDALEHIVDHLLREFCQ